MIPARPTAVSKILLTYMKRKSFVPETGFFPEDPWYNSTITFHDNPSIPARSWLR